MGILSMRMHNRLRLSLSSNWILLPLVCALVLSLGTALFVSIGRTQAPEGQVLEIPGPPLVSMIAVLADPVRYHGKEVDISGYVGFSTLPGRAFLFFNKDAHDYMLVENTIYLDTSRRLVDPDKLSGRMCTLRGIIDAHDRGPDIKGLESRLACTLRLLDVRFVYPPKEGPK
jgi:hypothetical protein